MKNNEKKVRKIVLSTLPRFWIYVLFSFAFALIMQLIGLIPPLIMRRVVDVYIPTGDRNNAILLIIFFISIPIGITLISTIYNYVITVAGRRMGQHLTMMGFEKLMYQSVDYFEKNNSAEIASYCKSEAMSYIVFWIFDIPQLFAHVFGGIVIFFLIVDVNLFIALGLLLYIPLSILPSRAFAKMVEQYVKKIVENNAKSNQLIIDTFRSIKFVKSMLLEKTQSAKMKQINESTVKVWSKTAAIENLNGSWTSSFLDNLFIGVVFSISAILIINNNLTLGSLLLLLSFLPRFFSAINSVAIANFHFRKQLAQYDEFFKLIVMEDERESNIAKGAFEFNKNIEFNDVHFSYENDRGDVLNGLSVIIQKNQWTGIVGQSGSGKTTMFDLLLKFYYGHSGSISIDGKDIADINAEDLRKNITKISQDVFLFPATLKENLLLVKPNASDTELLNVISDVGLSDFVNSLSSGLETYIGEGGVQLSGGQRQRLCLAQGLLRNSKILLLDEVTSNVDISVEEEIMNNIDSLMKKKDLTVVSISHRISFLSKANIIYTIENGAVVSKK